MSYEKANVVQWFSGFYEGEGYCSNDISNDNRLRLGIAQNDRTPLDIGQSIWGGHITKRIRKSPASDKICTGYEWRLSHHESLQFIQDIKPFMLIPYKIQQIDTALSRSKEGNSRRFSCKFCTDTFASGSGRRRHEKTFHINTVASNSNELRDNQIAGNP